MFTTSTTFDIWHDMSSSQYKIDDAPVCAIGHKVLFQCLCSSVTERWSVILTKRFGLMTVVMDDVPDRCDKRRAKLEGNVLNLLKMWLWRTESRQTTNTRQSEVKFKLPKGFTLCRSPSTPAHWSLYDNPTGKLGTTSTLNKVKMQPPCFCAFPKMQEKKGTKKYTEQPKSL